MVKVNVDLEKCTGCGTCVDNCPVDVFELVNVSDEQKARVVNEDECIICEVCVTTCSEEAIEVK
ncbi:MAG: ferredoxin family protein, partial [Candidatus Bathyarchaeota archaeon]